MVTDLGRQGLRPSVVVDVGANFGQFTVAALETWPRSVVMAFEPIPEAAHTLRQLTSEWPERLTVIQAAVGDHHGRVNLQVNEHSQASSVLQLSKSHLHAFPNAVPSRTVLVDMLTLDSALNGVTLPTDALLKLDVQGSERAVIDGARTRLADFRHVVVEASFKPLYDGEWTFRDLLGSMEKQCFRFLRPVGALREPTTGEYLQIDALFERL